MLHVEKERTSIDTEFRNLTRVIWCPYIPEDEAEGNAADPAKMLVLLHGTQVNRFSLVCNS